MASLLTRKEAEAVIKKRAKELDEFAWLVSQLTDTSRICEACGVIYSQTSRNQRCWCDHDSSEIPY